MGALALLRTFPDLASAEVAKALLEAEGIGALIEPTEALSAAIASSSTGIRLLVDATEEGRASRILRDSDLSDAELTFLATGKLPDGET